MKGFLPRVTALTISGVVCVGAAFFCYFYYTLYKNAVTDLEYRINAFDMRLATLEAHKSRELTPVHAWGIISTADRPKDERMRGYGSSGVFEVVGAKGGPVILPEFRLPVGSSTNCEYEIRIESQFGAVVDAWLSHTEPYQELAGFDEFRVSCTNQTNIVRLVARPRQAASIQIKFELVLLCLR